MIFVTCNACQKSLKVPDQFGGKIGACPHCKTKMRIPLPGQQAPPGGQAPPTGGQPTPPPIPHPQQPQQSPPGYAPQQPQPGAYTPNPHQYPQQSAPPPQQQQPQQPQQYAPAPQQQQPQAYTPTPPHQQRPHPNAPPPQTGYAPGRPPSAPVLDDEDDDRPRRRRRRPDDLDDDDRPRRRRKRRRKKKKKSGVGFELQDGSFFMGLGIYVGVGLIFGIINIFAPGFFIVSYIIFILGAIVSGLWFLGVVAVEGGAGWVVACFFCNIASLIFLATHFEACKHPFFLSLTNALVLGMAAAGVAIGGGEAQMMGMS